MLLPKMLKLTALVLGALLVSFHLRQMAAYSFNCNLDTKRQVTGGCVTTILAVQPNVH
jgi:hypothetical protein